jgi:hypothetical protein
LEVQQLKQARYTFGIQEEQEWLTVHDVEYGFSLLEDDDTKRVGLIKKILNPDYFVVKVLIHTEILFLLKELELS